MKKLSFSISEYCIDKDSLVPQRIADAILEHHILVMQPVRNALGKPVLVSDSSGFRPVAWEKAKKRSGNSQHTFPRNPGDGKGAADYASSTTIEELVMMMLKLNVPYNRIAVYPGEYTPFAHCDYASPTGQLQLIKGPEWEILSYDDFCSYLKSLN